MSSSTPSRNRPLRRLLHSRFLWITGGVILILVIGSSLFGGEEEASASATTFEVRRGNLSITVVEGGNAESLEPQTIKCEVKGREGVKIISIVDEGYRVTKGDVEDKKLLVELDSSELEDRIREQEIKYQTAKASLSEAQQKYEIQEKQNETDIQAAEREAKFKGMDLQKYLGDVLADELIASLHSRRAAEEAGEVARAAEEAAKSAEEAAKEQQAAFDKATEEAEKNKDSAGADATPAAADGPADAAEEKKGESQDESSADAAVTPPAENPPDRIAETKSEPPKEIPEGPDLDALAKAARASAQKAEEARKAAEGAYKRFAEATEAAQGHVKEREGDKRSFESAFEPFDFRPLSDDARLGGEADQELDKLVTDILLGEEELLAARKKLDGTQKLFDKDFVTEVDLEQDKMAVKRKEISLDSAKVSKDLYLRYKFPKQAEELFSQYEEALRKLDRVRKEADTKLLNAKVNVDSSDARFHVQEKARDEALEQRDKCKIVAEHEGLIVYGDSNNWYSWGRAEPIRQGSRVGHQQTLLTIPDITQMAVKVKIHESAIKKIKKGQKAKITVEAFPDENLSGEVTKVGVLPSSENRWLNPDLKVYEVTISVEGVHEWLKPGMTAEVEIDINTLEDVLYVPLQAVSSQGDDRVCFLASHDQRVVETGEFNDNYIEIKEGLEEGDVILLRPLRADSEKEPGDKGGEAKEEQSSEDETTT